MYNLEEEIASWRKGMAAGGVKAPAVLEELEGHLREEIHAQSIKGVSESEAFAIAMARVGSAKLVRAEFDKIKGTTSLPMMIGVSIWSLLVALMVVFIGWRVEDGKLGVLLGTHIFTLTTGFLGVFAVGSLGICYLYSQLLGGLSPERSRSLHRAALVFVRISLAFMAVGYLLGMLWTSKYCGFYWSGSVREIGSICTILWLLALIVIQRLKRVHIQSLMLLCASSNVVAAMGWFGAGILVVDPRLTHFLNYWPLEIFVMVHLLFLAMGFGRGLKPVES